MDRKPIFFKALVVNNNDPLNSRRVQVRVVGIHPMPGDDDYSLVPDECLPWAEPCIPITSGKNNGSYGDFDVPDKDDWVRVFFEDEGYQRPVYFGILVTRVDKRDDFTPGKNKVIHDRWNNHVEVNEQEIKITKNNGHVIHIHDNFIEITSKDGNSIKLDDSESSILIKDKNNNVIKTSRNELLITMPCGEYIKLLPSQIVLGTTQDSDVAVLGNALMWWLATHTHTGNLGLPTSVPLQFEQLKSILKNSIQYQPINPYTDTPSSSQGITGSAANFTATKKELEEELKSLIERDGEEDVTFAIEMDKQYKKIISEETDEVIKIDTTQSEFEKKYPLRDVKYAKFDEDSLQKLKDLHPKLQDILNEAIKRYDFIITSGYRSPEYQYSLFKQKLTPCDGYTKKSLHNTYPSPAVDIVPRKGGTSNLNGINELYEVLTTIAAQKNIRLRWLGNVYMPNGKKDLPHYELFNGIG